MKRIALLFLLSVSALFGQSDMTGRILWNENPEARTNPYFPFPFSYAPSLKFPEMEGVVWEERNKEVLRLNGTDLLLVTYEWPGNAAALLLFDQTGGTCLGGYLYVFGGNGAELEVLDKSVRGDKLILNVMCRGFFNNAYGEDPATHEETVQLKVSIVKKQ